MPPGTPWHEELRAVLTTSFPLGVEHPAWASVYLRVRRVPESRRRGAHDVALLEGAGFSRREAAGAMLALVSYLTGFQVRTANITPAADPLAHKSREEAFLMGLDAILQGLQAQARDRQTGSREPEGTVRD